ncbi:MAG: hypothetical protein K8F30_02805 [Taibaiella sp.]|nr:hypothetical protein [Taibaiella sp.]
MNRIIPVILLLNLAACVNNPTEQPSSISADTINAEVKYPAYHSTDTCYTITSADTILLDKHILYFENADSISFPPYHDNNPVTDSLWESYGTPADSLEKAAILKYANIVSATDFAIWVKLLNGKTLKLNRHGNTIDDSWCYFEAYLEKANCVLIHLYYIEGDEYILINRENGFAASIYGKPYFAPDNKSFITINMDIAAGFSFNGMEYYIIEADTFGKMFELPLNGCGPVQANWLRDNTVIIETYCEDFSVDSFRHWTDYLKLTIINN